MSHIKNQGWIYRDFITKLHGGKTVLEYYSQKYLHSSKAEWQERIINGQISLFQDDSLIPINPQTRLKVGQCLAYHRLPWYEPAVPLNYEIIYQDQDLIAINKPSGLPVLPGGNFLQNTLWWQLQQDYPENTPVPIHRLGRGTSGLLLLGRSSLAKSVLSQQMRSNSAKKEHKKAIVKTYRALVSGNSIPECLIICDRIGKIPHPQLGYIYGATSEGKHAHTECQTIHRGDNTTIVEANILTGRPHQIRIHLAAAGYPLVGDPLYLPGGIPQQSSEGVNMSLPGDCGYYLHAYRLSFLHPRSKVKIDLESLLPKQLRQAY